MNPRPRGSLLFVFSIGIVGFLIAACSTSGATGSTPTDSPSPSANATAGASGTPPLIPANAGLDKARALVKDPNRDPLPANQELADQIKLGYQIMVDTPGQAGHYAGNGLSCTNCHLNAGQKDKALPLTGIAADFPQYSARDRRLITLEDRIRGCFLRSENGTAPPYDSKELLAVAAYITWISYGQPVGQTPPWAHQNRIAKENLLPPEKLNPDQDKQLFDQQCVACHGLDGQGLQLGQVKPGALWGPQSWNDGAGLTRVETLAGFIRYAMPLNAPGSLTDEQAQQIAAFIDSQPRPHFERQASDAC